MTERKDLWWVLPVSAALLVLIAASGAANFIYGLDFGGPIIGGVSIASDLIKVVALIGVFSLWRNRHRLQASALAILFVGFTVWSMISAVGFISSKFSTLQDTRGKTASEWQELSGEISRLKAQREKVLDVRPQATIQAEINSILRIPGVNGCAAIDGPVTRQHCPKFGELKAELGHAERAIWLDGKLETLRNELKKTDRVTVVDPRTDSLAAVFAAGPAAVVLFVKLFIAILVEAATAFGLWAVWSPFFGRTPQKLQEPGKLSPVSVSIQSPRGPAGLPDVIQKAQAKPMVEAPVDPEPETPPDGDGTPKEEPQETVAEVSVPETTVVNFPAPPKPLSKREKAKQKKELVERKNRELVESFVVERLDTDHPRAEIELTGRGGHRAGGTSGDDIYQEFRRYCKSRGVPGVGKSHLGRFIGEFVDRARNHKGVVYGAIIKAEARRKVA